MSWRALTALAAALFSADAARADVVWYEGGTLHEEPLNLWIVASDANRLATAADFTLVALGMEFVQRTDMSRLKPYATELKACIDRLAANANNSAVIVNKSAAACVDRLGWV